MADDPVAERYAREADALLEGVLDDPAPRALRIAGLYASFFLEEPFLFRWGGIAAFVAVHVHRALLAPRVGEARWILSHDVAEVLADANVGIYRRLVPAWLAFRGERATGGEPGLELLARADALVRTDPVAADEAAYAAVVTLSRVEQERVVQPALDRLDPALQRSLAPFYAFRLGFDSGAPTCGFRGENPADLAERWAWTAGVVLPWCRAQLRERPEAIRADAERIRRLAGVRLDGLPRRRTLGERPPG